MILPAGVPFQILGGEVGQQGRKFVAILIEIICMILDMWNLKESGGDAL